MNDLNVKLKVRGGEDPEGYTDCSPPMEVTSGYTVEEVLFLGGKTERSVIAMQETC